MVHLLPCLRFAQLATTQADASWFNHGIPLILVSSTIDHFQSRQPCQQTQSHISSCVSQVVLRVANSVDTNLQVFVKQGTPF